ncbi:hypothetical protein LSH36_589g01021 [Paralvinella palmiformis]|uniref:Uncharacterized protein n=1 Tax=Paralvinella palmiformis TaxID=53620 RepID=A0AAD9J5U2_9ANNE|nr:hypothetical protein LSH36_589g01021 [Paralvinella palmiformis]
MVMGVGTIKARLAKSKEVSWSSNCAISRTSPVTVNRSAIIVAPVSMTTTSPPNPNLHHSKAPPDPTPDGHRAPVAELLCTTRSVDTQTPAVEELLPYLSLQEELKEQEEGRHCSSGGSNSSPCSVSPPCSSLSSFRTINVLYAVLSGLKLVLNTQCDSPNLKSIFTREPPDGCERIKIVQEENGTELSSAKRGLTPPLKDSSLFCPIKKPSERYSIPSEVSAFCPLLKPYVQQPSEMALRSSPSSISQAIEGQ